MAAPIAPPPVLPSPWLVEAAGTARAALTRPSRGTMAARIAFAAVAVLALALGLGRALASRRRSAKSRA